MDMKKRKKDKLLASGFNRQFTLPPVVHNDELDYDLKFNIVEKKKLEKEKNMKELNKQELMLYSIVRKYMEMNKLINKNGEKQIDGLKLFAQISS